MKFLKFVTANVILAAICLILFSFSLGSQDWGVSKEWKDKKNTKSGTASVDEGKKIWNLTCKSCHGETGKGNKAKKVSALNQSFTDGELFYITSMSRGSAKSNMPAYHKDMGKKAKGGDNKLSEDDVWNLVSYMRTLK